MSRRECTLSFRMFFLRLRQSAGPWVIAALALASAGCLGPSRVAGGGSEATNGNIVAGSLDYSDGTPAKDARVWIRSSGYLEDTSETGELEAAPDAIADQGGRFTLDSLAAGDYLLEVRDGRGNGVVRALSTVGRVTELPADTLRLLGALEGRLERLGNVPQRAYARLYGLERVVKADTAGNFAFYDLPSGNYRLQGVTSLPGHGFQRSAPVLITPGGMTRIGTVPLVRSTDEDYATWPFSRMLRLSTASIAGADTVTDFPLLIRLHSGNFDFSLCNGNDLRFAGADGRHLAYEIERWQPPLAEVWVKLDSLPGGATVDLTMHWGKPAAPDFSFGPAVFSGFGGVWHLQEATGFQGELTALDASPHAAAAQGRIVQGDRSGSIGKGAGFQAVHALKVLGHAGLRPASRLTFSTWIKPAAGRKRDCDILSMGDSYAMRISAGDSLRVFHFNDTAWKSGAPIKEGSWNDTGARLKTSSTGWHHIAGVLDGDSLRLYLDGVPRASVFSKGRIAYVRGEDLILGSHGFGQTGFEYSGQLDEVQIAGTARSGAWVKLAHETQKPGSAVLEFR